MHVDVMTIICFISIHFYFFLNYNKREKTKINVKQKRCFNVNTQQ